MIKEIFCRYVFEPLYYLHYGGLDAMRFYSFIEKAQWNSLEINKNIQEKLLYNLLDYASNEIPYYNRIFKEKNLKLTKKNSVEILHKLPVLTKEIVRQEFDNLSKIIPYTGHYISTSGGSTGKPVRLYQDNRYKAKMVIVKRWQKEWGGVALGSPSIKLWGSEAEIMHEKEHIQNRFANWMRSIRLLNSFAMDDKKMREYVDIINKQKPVFILSYARSINELAKFILEHKIKIHQPKSIMTSAGILYPEFRKNIESAFNCPVYDRYGSREVGDIACECDKHEGLHISMFNHYVEILNKDMKPCKEGESGDIYITLLTNFTMPLIRYKIGDVGVYTEKKCSCGRGLSMIKNIVGRDLDNFITKTGKIIHGGLFVHFIGVVFNNEGIERFQVIQKSPLNILIKAVVIDKKKFDEKKGEIDEFIRKIMGSTCKITWKPVKDIKPAKSGKYRYTMREF
ncbi:MAG: phenylacetate--CoA ligase family protein [Candidatus Woesearchaeota archaeon]